MPVRGGKKLKRAIQAAKHARGVSQVDVGFFKSAKYPNGTPVVLVANVNEFGSKKRGIPERAFFRSAILNIGRVIRPIIRRNVDPKTLTVSRRVGGLVGSAVQDRVQRSIVLLRHPPNKEETIKRKKSSNPLIHSGLMRLSVTYRLHQ